MLGRVIRPIRKSTLKRVTVTVTGHFAATATHGFSQDALDS